jgi:hypothetical protein
MTLDVEDGFVHLMSGEGYPLSQVYDETNDKYFSPITPECLRAPIKAHYLSHPGASAERFDAVWPKLWQLTDVTYDKNFGLTAIVDSGVLSAHPMLYGCIRDIVDFTREGGEDRLGHGTTVALIWRRDMLGIPAKQLIILKCIGADGIGTEENLIDALQWIRNYNEHNNPKIADVVLSLGKYNKRGLGLLACDGTCKLCCEAIETSKSAKLFAAAGNLSGKTACPARAAFLPSKPNIFAVTRPDETTAGKGTVSGTTGDADPEHVPFFTFVRTKPTPVP